jgi:hypothetical protein
MKMGHMMEQRVNVNFCVKLQKLPREMLGTLKIVYGNPQAEETKGCQSQRSKQR